MLPIMITANSEVREMDVLWTYTLDLSNWASKRFQSNYQYNRRAYTRTT
jgi:hypothetical protein